MVLWVMVVYKMPRKDSFPLVDPTVFTQPPARPDESVHCIVLAAGTSNRFGSRNKLCSPLGGEPLIRHVISTMVHTVVDAVTVVVGYQPRQITKTIVDFDVDIVVNDRFGDGQSSSVRAGVEHVQQQGVDAVLVALGDMPYVSTASVDRVVSAYRQGVGDALAAAYRGTRGNPVLFDERYFDALSSLDGDSGGRDLLFNADNAVLVETGDRGVLRDIDRPSDMIPE